MKVSPRLPLTLLMGLWRQPTDLSVLFWFMTVVGEDVPPHLPGWVWGRHKVISEDLNLDERQIRRALRRLIDFGVMEQLAERYTVYRINSTLVTKGVSSVLEQKYKHLKESQDTTSSSIVVPREKTRQQIRAMLDKCRIFQEVKESLPDVSGKRLKFG